jgi:uncharacterized protein YbbC (DUF1343 family)
MPVLLGIDRLIASGLLYGLRIGVVCNPASVSRGFHHASDRLAHEAGARLEAIFGPQHGFRSDVQDNMIETPHAADRTRRVPVFSLYSDTREPTPDMLKGLQAVVVDLQDVGTRVYTYVYTMANVMRACSRAGVPVVVCDRPNPIGGAAIEGPVLDPRYTSFVGQFGIPLRHGLTIAELARLFNEHFGIGAKLEVMTMEGWRRGMYFDETGLPWVMTSPNIPTLDSTTVYPGAVLFEGTNVSEGRGTTRPFELLGAPWIDPEPFATDLNGMGLPGVFFRPVVFEPTFHKHARTACGGCQIHVTDRTSFRPVETAIVVMDAFRRAAPDQFGWKPPPYEYEHDKQPIDVLYGSDALRLAMRNGFDPRALARTWQPELAAFERIRDRYLLY